MPVKWISALLLLQISCCFRSVKCGKVLVWPMDFSHWMNIKIILDELVQRGHEVTVLRPSAYYVLDPKTSPGLKFETFPTSVSKDDLEKFFIKILNLWTYELPRDTCLSYSPFLENMFDELSGYYLSICKDVVSNRELMTKLQESKFDVLLSDPTAYGGELIAELLHIPFLYSIRFTGGYKIEKSSGGFLLPPFYVPVILSGLGGQMTFIERVKNMICMLYFDFWFHVPNDKKWDSLYSEYLGKLHFFSQLLEYLSFTTFILPEENVEQDMEEYVQSSGDHGVVVFSLGSMFSNMTEEKANTIAWALAQIPQKVLWKFDGKTPATLGPNTRVYKWLPQNDLLGHPKTKAFITHGGTNSIYEAIYHGIPMIGIPLFGEQHDNIAYMVAKGAAVTLNIRTMSRSDVLTALEEVIVNPFYKKNAMWLSTIHHDQPMKPLDRAVFWVEFVMRHKSAKHLRPLGHNLTWYQSHSLDVIGFLLACVAGTVVLTVKCLLFIYRFFETKEKNMKNE
ncbi:UDP-glucuronosyltransferase 2B17-like [Mus caroli]|uniref:UDP-glucuronosyltransferase n=1 Tax=Mus caroli TaxID=10089 RepID=A0A6P7QSQ3_MUSCR|nr:UDP-glucuronosyltransferase 2B17-like [Mus caroli]